MNFVGTSFVVAVEFNEQTLAHSKTGIGGGGGQQVEQQTQQV